MALRFNGLSPTGANPFSAMCTSPIGNTAGGFATTSNLITRFGRGERHAVKTSFGELASNPPASESPIAWTMADIGGDMAAENSLGEGNSLTLVSLSLGKDLSASLEQDGSITAAALSMITSLSANLEQAGQLTGPMQMTLNLASDMVQEGQITAALGLIAWCQSSMAQDNDMSASNLRGEMNMAASIVSYGELTPEGLRDAVWSAVLANYPTSGTAGNTLALAGSGGVDYTALGVAVWNSVSRTLTEGAAPDTTEIADAVRIELASELLRIVELAKVHGLVSGSALVVTPTSRVAGDISQSISSNTTTTTVTRL